MDKKKIPDVNIITLKKKWQVLVLYEKNAFKINFGPREVPQSENA